MDAISLRMFVTKVVGKRRIGFGDLRRFQREVLPGGIMNRGEAELLLALNDVVPRLDRAWPDYLVGAVTEYAVWREEPAGSVGCDTAKWLDGVLSAEGSSKVAKTIARSVAREAGPIASFGPAGPAIAVREKPVAGPS
jgi:hypothetical protein